MRERLIELLAASSKVVGEYIDNSDHMDLPTPTELCAVRADYLLANGVIVPPCKVGDKVYFISNNPINLSVKADTIYEADVVRIVTTHLGTTLVIQIHNEYGCTEIPDVKDFGKTVFLTREEAENALSKLQASYKQIRKEDEGKCIK